MLAGITFNEVWQNGVKNIGPSFREPRNVFVYPPCGNNDKWVLKIWLVNFGCCHVQIFSQHIRNVSKKILWKNWYLGHLYFSTQHAPAPSKVLPQTASFKNYWYIVLHIEIKLITKYFLLHISVLRYQELMFDNFVRADHY